MAPKTLAEVIDALAEAAPELRQAAGAEYHDDDDEDQQQFAYTQSKHFTFPPPYGGAADTTITDTVASRISRNAHTVTIAPMLDLTGLNPQQREAVTHGEGPLLVLAGAGSGKTRVITYRIAWLIGERGVHPSSILAVTFTNKAANEMLHRVERLVPNIGARPWIGTFHSTSLRMLRRYADRLGFTKSFAVYDTADQLTLIRRCMRELQMNDDAFPPRAILNRISNGKNELIGPAEYEKENTDFFGARVAEVYRMYQKRLKEFDAMDFDDLIGNYVLLLEKNDDIRAELHQRFPHLLIDEYQDTNRAQYVLIKLLAGERGDVMAVGDEDQSIYRFRGADINNILNFERDFPGA
ncbi:MAG: ATP-dependent helicase UvrD/PcrA, partial [Thermoanaerobaculia bacterium]|nr:ATP-dependent helicase UvrD/PcrA [Thermoanaerobaculia bacterium]